MKLFQLWIYSPRAEEFVFDDTVPVCQLNVASTLLFSSAVSIRLCVFLFFISLRAVNGRAKNAAYSFKASFNPLIE